MQMSAPSRKAASSRTSPAPGQRVRSRSRRRATAPAAETLAQLPQLAPRATPARQRRDADEAAHAAAIGAALIGPFVLAGAIGLRLLRHFTRPAR